jgi:WD40 repeat protein
MKSIQAWGFLVSRNQYLDYRTVVAPNFMCQAGASSILAKAAEGDLTEKGSAFYREIHNSKVGNLTLIFRVIEATAEDTGIAGNGVLKDSFGREIYLIEGIVLKEIMPDIVATQENIEETHKQLVEYYREFWDCTTPNSAIPSEPFTLQADKSLGNCLDYHKLKEYVVDVKPKAISEKIVLVKKINNIEQIHSWRCIIVEKRRSEISSVAFFPDGDLLAIRYDPQHQKIIVWNWRENKELFKVRGQHIRIGSYPTPVVINSTGQFIASAMIEHVDQNVVKLWNINTKEVKDLGEHEWNGLNRVKAVAFTHDSKIVASGGGDKTIQLWDVKEERLELGKLTGHSSEVRYLVIAPDGESLASGDGHGVIKFWNLRTKREIRSIKASSLPIRSLAFSPDSQMLVSGSDDYRIKLWNAKTGKEDCTLGQHSAPVNSVAFSPDGKIIASGSDDSKIKIWELKSQPAISVLSGHTNAVTSVAFSPNGKTIVSGSKDCTIRLWQHI